MDNLKVSISRQLMRYVLLSWIALIFIFPLIFMIVSSLKPDLQLLRDSSSFRAFLPVGDISFNNYIEAFDRAPIFLFIGNSIFITATTIILSMFACSLAAFSFVFLEWKGKGVILSIILSTLIIPFEAIAIPLLLIVNFLPWVSVDGISIGWLNSYQVQIIPFIADAITIYLFVQYFKDLPKELVEAAHVDGASWFRIYSKIILPLSGPIFATAAILKFLAMYNNQFLWPIMVAQEEQFRPVMVGLLYFFQLNVAWGEVMAYLSIITIPVLAFYISMQKAFVASVANTGIKG